MGRLHSVMKKVVNNIGFRVLLLILSLYCSSIFLLAFYSEQEDNTSDTNNDPYLEKYFPYVSDVNPLITGTKLWKNGIKVAEWNQSVVHIGYNEYNQDWAILLTAYNLTPCNIVDIGANDGDTSLNLAQASNEGTVVAFEMGPPLAMLKHNVKLNPQFKIDIHHAAISDKYGLVSYESGCNGCNGGISEGSNSSSQYSVRSVKLVPFLIQNYPQHFLDNIKMVKIDTEGHDVVILEDLKHFNFRPPIIWTEWFQLYKFVNISNIGNGILEEDNFCTPNSARLFNSIIDLGFDIFHPSLPLKRMIGCANKYYEKDLLLIDRNFLEEKFKHQNISLPINYKKPYEIKIWDDIEKFDIEF